MELSRNYRRMHCVTWEVLYAGGVSGNLRL